MLAAWVLGYADAAMIVRRVAEKCGSTAMVLCMHYCGVAVLEAHAPNDLRRAAAAGTHLSTLAFSEAASLSHFWAPQSTAAGRDGDVLLNARKSRSSSPRVAAELSFDVHILPFRHDQVRQIPSDRLPRPDSLAT
jgi:alkylation response protein AidB-like acyl-CoA dehydrogenase